LCADPSHVTLQRLNFWLYQYLHEGKEHFQNSKLINTLGAETSSTLSAKKELKEDSTVCFDYLSMHTVAS